MNRPFKKMTFIAVPLQTKRYPKSGGATINNVLD